MLENNNYVLFYDSEGNYVEMFYQTGGKEFEIYVPSEYEEDMGDIEGTYYYIADLNTTAE